MLAESLESGGCPAPWAGFQPNRASRCWHHQPSVWDSLGRGGGSKGYERQAETWAGQGEVSEPCGPAAQP